MRVLLVPELYRPDDATANGTLNDAVQLVEEWLNFDSNLHVYWLLAPPDVADYDREYVLADRERVTLIEAEPFMYGHEHEDAFSETGYTEAQFRAIEETVFDRSGYVDVVVDQQVTGRYDLYKWLHRLGGGPKAAVQPTELIGDVHDLRLPFKRHGQGMPDDAPTKAEISAATYADGLWFKAGVDRSRMREYGTAFLDSEFLDDLLDDALETGSPLDFSAFSESYADRPERLHVAGSGWDKKNVDVVLSAAETLHDEFGIRTLMTNMDPIPERMADREFVNACPECSREEYATALRNGDLAICASDHETMPRTPFEQAASGQVLVIRDEPWIYDCVPEDYRFAGDAGDLGDLAAEAVENWESATEANRRLVARVEEIRDPDRSARRTHRDLRERVESKRQSYDLDSSDAPVRAALADERGANAGGARVATRSRAEARASASGGAPTRAIDLNILREATADHTDDGRPVTDSEDYALADLVYALRSLGYRDAGNPGTPIFVRE